MFEKLEQIEKNYGRLDCSDLIAGDHVGHEDVREDDEAAPHTRRDRGKVSRS